MNVRTKKGFTLTEVVVALGIGTVVMAGVMMFLVQSLLVCRDVMAETYMCQQSRLARERIQRKINNYTEHGLREAEWESLNVWGEGGGIDFTVTCSEEQWADEDDVQKDYCYLDAYGYHLMRYDFDMERELSYTKAPNRTIDTELKMVLNFGGKVYTNFTVISTRVVN